MDHRTYDGWLLGLPGVTQDVKWGNDLVYSVGGKMFAVTCLDGADAGRVSFKVEQERFLELTDMPGVVPAPYLARVHWVLLQQPADHPPEWVRERLLRAYQLVREKLPKKVQAALGAV